MRNIFCLSVLLCLLFLSPATFGADRTVPGKNRKLKTFGYAVENLLRFNSDSSFQTIENAFEQLYREDRMINNFSVEDMPNLPLGLVNQETSTAKQLVILISGGRSLNGKKTIDAFLQLPFAPTGDVLYFSGKHIPFTQGGLGGGGSSRLYLEHIAKNKNPNNKQGFSMHLETGRDKTYIQWGCSGIERFRISGYFEFSSGMLAVDRSIEKGYAHDKIRAYFSTEGTDIDNILAEVTFPAFQIKGLEDFSFIIDKATVDLSETENPAGVDTHPLYQETISQTGTLWTGFFANEARIVMPEFLQKGGETERRSFGISDMIIDKKGVTGDVSLTNIFNINEGNAGGWPLSISNFMLKIQQNSLVGGGFGGKLRLPISDEDNLIAYEALMYHNDSSQVNYSFSISATRDIKCSALMADIHLLPTSVIRLHKNAGEDIYAEAFLNGDLTIKRGKSLKIPNIGFERLHLKSKDPYVESGYFELLPSAASEKAKIASFSLNINKVGLRVDKGNYTLFVDGGINLMNSKKEKNIFSGSTGLLIKGKVQGSQTSGGGDVSVSSQNHQKWIITSSEIETLRINANIGVLSLAGSASFFDKGHQSYDAGFQGQLEVTVGGKKKNILQIGASGMFASKEDKKYWYLDMMYGPQSRGPKAQLGTGVIKRLAGGFAYNMRPKNMDRLQTALYSQSPAKSQQEIQETWTPNPTRLEYEPIEDDGISTFIDIVLQPGAKTKSITIQGHLELEINANGGLNKIQVGGAVYVMPKKEADGKLTSKIGGEAMIGYDFVNKELHAEFGMAFETASLVSARIFTVLHFGKDNWWVYLGTPSKRIEVTVPMLGQVSAYLMVGTKLEPFPPPRLNGFDFDGDFTRGGLDTETGGIAFGASLMKQFGGGFPKKNPVFFAILELTVGMDIAFMDVRGLSCVGRSGDIGVKGWYATGQAYAGVYGAVGIELKKGFFKGRFELFSVAAGVVLTANLPNPTWVQGFVFGKFSILGGLVSGKVNFKVTVGERCEIEGTIPGMEVRIIGSVTPEDGETEVDVFAVPQVLFEVPIDKSIPVTTAENTQKFKAVFDYLRVRHGSEDIEGEIQWNKDKDLVAFKPNDILPEKSNIRISVKVHWQEYKNGAFVNMVSGGKLVEETKEITITTGKAPDYLRKDNVLFSYPEDGQYNYYQNEHRNAYLQLDRPQAYLWEKHLNGEEVRFEVWLNAVNGGDTLRTPLKIDLGQKRLSFDMPVGLEKEQAYKVAIWRVADSKELNLDENVSVNNVQIGDDENLQMTKREKSIINELSNVNSKELYSSYFRVSKYATFREKMAQVPNMNVVKTRGSVDQYRQLGLNLELDETFDAFELVNRENSRSLIEVNSTPLEQLPAGHWVKAELVPQIYNRKTFSANGRSFKITHRDIAENGHIPLRRFRNQYYYGEMKNTRANLVDGSVTTEGLENIFWYDVSFHSYKDFRDLKDQMSAAFRNVPNENVPDYCKAIYLGGYQAIKAGIYTIEFNYKLPGSDNITSTVTKQMIWEVR